MPATTVHFFNPADVLGTDFEIQSRSPSKSINRAQGLGADGDEIASHTYGAQTSDTAVYKCFTASGTLSLADVIPGTVIDGWHIDSVSVKYSATDWPEISITAHIHDQCETGITSHGTEHRKISGTLLTLPAGFGCPDSALKSLVGLSAETKLGIASFAYDLGIVHQDEVGSSGNYLASDNRDGSESISIDLVGVPSADPSATDWDLTSKSTPTSNTAAETSSYTLERHLATDVDEDED